MPSSRATSSATAGASRSFSSKAGLCDWARCTNSCTDGVACSTSRLALRSGTASGRIGKVFSPGTCSGSRLDAIMRTLGAALTMACASSAEGLIRCSQLSRMSSARLLFRCAPSVASIGRPGSSATSSTRAASAATSPPSLSGDRSRNHTPSGYKCICSAATCSDSRVLPSPPMPSSVTKRAAASMSFASSISRSRPMNDVPWCGRLFGISLTGIHQSPVCTTLKTLSLSAGAMKRSSGKPTSNSSIGSATPLICQCPCDCALSTVLPRSSRASGVSSVCPPRANDMTRAAVGLARPSTSSGLAPRATSSALFSRRITGPTCSPARAFSGTGRSAKAW